MLVKILSPRRISLGMRKTSSDWRIKRDFQQDNVRNWWMLTVLSRLFAIRLEKRKRQLAERNWPKALINLGFIQELLQPLLIIFSCDKNAKLGNKRLGNFPATLCTRRKKISKIYRKFGNYLDNMTF